MLNHKIDKRKETEIDGFVIVESYNFYYFLYKILIK